jgi:hypothetical protein
MPSKIAEDGCGVWLPKRQSGGTLLNSCLLKSIVVHEVLNQLAPVRADSRKRQFKICLIRCGGRLSGIVLNELAKPAVGVTV